MAKSQLNISDKGNKQNTQISDTKFVFILKPFEQNIPEDWKLRSFTQLQMKFWGINV
jgi:hypothetical protein